MTPIVAASALVHCPAHRTRAVSYTHLDVYKRQVIGLYLSFAIPIYLRWKVGDAFQQGPWNLGTKWRWMAPVAVAEILVISIYFILPITPAGTPGNADFQMKFVNYAPILTGGALILLWIGWHLSAKKWFTGPKMTVDLPAGVTAADEIALEHEHKGFHQPPSA